MSGVEAPGSRLEPVFGWHDHDHPARIYRPWPQEWYLEMVKRGLDGQYEACFIGKTID